MGTGAGSFDGHSRHLGGTEALGTEHHAAIEVGPSVGAALGKVARYSSPEGSACVDTCSGNKRTTVRFHLKLFDQLG